MTDEETKTELDDQGEMRFMLTTPFDYSKGGEQLTAEFIVCTAPSSNQMKECAFLKQAFFRALPDGDSEASGEADPDDLDMSGSDVMMMIAQSDGVKLSDVLEVGWKLIGSGVALVDGEQKLTEPLIKKMSLDDLESLIGDYIVNFVIASSLKRMKERLSQASST